MWQGRGHATGASQTGGDRDPTASGAAGSGVILRHYIRRNAPAGADRNTLLRGPGPDRGAALAACGRSPGPVPWFPPGPPGVLDERCQFAAEGGGVLLVQVDLIRRAADREPHRLGCWAAIEIVFQRDGYLRCHPGLHDCAGGLRPLIKSAARLHPAPPVPATTSPRSAARGSPLCLSSRWAPAGLRLGPGQ